MDRRGSRQPRPQPRVLRADGHADTRELYAMALTSFGFETTIASDGADAFARARQTHPDIVVTELFFPRLDGWKLIRDLKRDARTRDIPIVIVTSDAQPRARVRAHHAAPPSFLVHPL